MYSPFHNSIPFYGESVHWKTVGNYETCGITTHIQGYSLKYTERYCIIKKGYHEEIRMKYRLVR